jgi:Tol biopolymer transport system component
LGGGLIYVNLETGASTGLGPGNNVQWSPDGSFFLFDRTTDDGHRLLTGDIIFMKRDETTASNLTENFDGVATQPTVSPDGKRVAFESNGRIFVGDLVW